MASVTSLMSSSSSTSSIYGSRSANIISGLASGLDTEGMIEQLVQSYSNKITSLEKKNTKYTWEQESIQSISNRLIEFSRKYMSASYGSTTNLSSVGFFTKSTNTTTMGTYANKVSASGKSSSTVQLNGVAQLASAARYSVSAANLQSGETNAIDLSADTVTVSKVSGSLQLQFGGGDNAQTISLSFSEDELFDDGTGQLDQQKFVDAINEKLKDKTVKLNSGSATASERITASIENGQIVFKEKAGNNIDVVGATGNLKDAISLVEDDDGNFTNAFEFTRHVATEDVAMSDYLKDKTMTITLDGTSKTIKLSCLSNAADAQSREQALRDEIEKQFGAGKITFDQDNQNNQDGKLSFSVANGSTISVTSTANDVLGMEGGLTNYFNTNKTLNDLLGYTGSQTLTINGTDITVDANDSISDIMDAINSSDAGVKVSFSKMTNKFVFEAKETGAQGKISMDNDLAQTLFGNVVDANGNKVSGYSDGKDAIYQATVNGDPVTLTSSSNTVDLDGLKVTFEGTFNTSGKTVGNLGQGEGLDALFSDGDAVTFKTTSDTDTIISAVRDMVNEYNSIMEDVKKMYSTMPLQQSNGNSYEPLSDKDMEDMSDSAIEKYEEKAKTGLLFMDKDLSALYSSMRSAISGNSAAMKAIGLSTSYEDGLTTLTLDESALKEALESDPDKVSSFFTGKDGLMSKMKDITDRYASTTGATKGILIERAGSKYSPTASLQNKILTQKNKVDQEIEKWQEKLQDQIQYYTRQFSRLETLMNEMNSQSSALSGLMGY